MSLNTSTLTQLNNALPDPSLPPSHLVIEKDWVPHRNSASSIYSGLSL